MKGQVRTSTYADRANAPGLPQVLQALPFALAVSASLWLVGFALLMIDHVQG